MDETDADRKALERFVVGNAELEKLEAMLDRFNIFEAVGMERQEIRHSMFLSFLLDPNQPHGMGDAFLKRFLQSAVAGSDSTVVTPIELSLWDLGGTSVRREWNYIDIFLLDEENRLAVIVENKVGTKEHSNQLERYYNLVREQHPNHKILAVYLTPDGDEPSHPEYLTLGYGEVCETLDGVRQSRSSTIEPDAAVLVRHYTDMLRRNIVGDSEIARLAQQIYQKHQQAIDLIIENRLDAQSEIRSFIESLVERENSLVRDSGGKRLLRFIVTTWDTPNLLVSVGWTKSKRILMLEFWINPENLTLSLVIGPGPEGVRHRLFELASQVPDIFEEAWKAAGAWYIIYSREFLSGSMYENTTDAERKAEIRKNWNDFLENDLPRIDAALRAEEWIWEDTPKPASD